MKKLKLTQLTQVEIDKNQLSEIKGGNEALFCGCGDTCRLTGERGTARGERRVHPPQFE